VLRAAAANERAIAGDQVFGEEEDEVHGVV